VIRAAKKARVRLLAYTSALYADTSRTSIAVVHEATEAEIRSSGLPFVFLRNGRYIETCTEDLAGPLARGVFYGAAGDGRIAAATRLTTSTPPWPSSHAEDTRTGSTSWLAIGPSRWRTSQPGFRPGRAG